VRLAAHHETLNAEEHKSLAIYALETMIAHTASVVRNHGYLLSPDNPLKQLLLFVRGYSVLFKAVNPILYEN
jgi:hypothetical protein